MPETHTPEAIESRVVEALESFDVDPDLIRRETPLETLDVDSLDVVELAEILRSEMGIDIEARDFVDVRTFGDVMDVIVARANAV
jgi:acyl carrier protein